MFPALFSALFATEPAGSEPVQMFEEACLATAGQAFRLEAAAQERGWIRQVGVAPMFEEAAGVSVYSAGAITIRLEVFDAVSKWMDAPLNGETPQSLRISGDRSSAPPQIPSEESATSICLIEFEEGGGDIVVDLDRLTVEGRRLSRLDSETDFHARKWRVDGAAVVDIQYLQAVAGRDLPGTRSTLVANFRL